MSFMPPGPPPAGPLPPGPAGLLPPGAPAPGGGSPFDAIDPAALDAIVAGAGQAVDQFKQQAMQAFAEALANAMRNQTNPLAAEAQSLPGAPVDPLAGVPGGPGPAAGGAVGPGMTPPQEGPYR